MMVQIEMRFFLRGGLCGPDWPCSYSVAVILGFYVLHIKPRALFCCLSTLPPSYTLNLLHQSFESMCSSFKFYFYTFLLKKKTKHSHAREIAPEA